MFLEELLLNIILVPYMKRC